LTELAERVAGVEARVENLETWQKSQNGAILRVDQKVDRLQFWIMGTAVSAVLNLLLLIATIVLER
jgi:hypothetical protein